MNYCLNDFTLLIAEDDDGMFFLAKMELNETMINSTLTH